MRRRGRLRRALLLAACASRSAPGPLRPASALAAPDAPAPAVDGAGRSPPPSSRVAPAPSLPAAVDAREASRRIRAGRVYVRPNFLSEAQVRCLQRDMRRMESDGKFVVNGLSDVRKGLKGETLSSSSDVSDRANQGFDVKYDRSVCPIPWWRDALSLSVGDTGACSDGEENLLLSIQTKLQRLRRDLSGILDRPTMMDNDLGHECYYSQSAPGSSLARHMDERHEETKGARGWLLPSRRSVSWLVYLSEAAEEGDAAKSGEWDAQINGGLLRTFPQKGYRSAVRDGAGDGEWGDAVDCGSHDGNLQVGWLLGEDDERGGIDDNVMSTHPVFLDSWFDHVNPYTGIPEPHCILYVVGRSSKSDGERIEYISAPWSIDAVGGGNVADFVGQHSKLEAASSDASSSAASTSLFLRSSYARRFRLLEDRDAWTRGQTPAGSTVEDHLPTRGTLVAFDSVALPHEVTAVRGGRRAALAGWFHEATQPLGGNTSL